jgi:hypothetical protein
LFGFVYPWFEKNFEKLELSSFSTHFQMLQWVSATDVLLRGWPDREQNGY